MVACWMAFAAYTQKPVSAGDCGCQASDLQTAALESLRPGGRDMDAWLRSTLLSGLHGFPRPPARGARKALWGDSFSHGVVDGHCSTGDRCLWVTGRLQNPQPGSRSEMGELLLHPHRRLFGCPLSLGRACHRLQRSAVGLRQARPPVPVSMRRPERARCGQAEGPEAGWPALSRPGATAGRSPPGGRRRPEPVESAQRLFLGFRVT